MTTATRRPPAEAEIRARATAFLGNSDGYFAPVYGRGTGRTVDGIARRVSDEGLTEAIVLLPARTDTRWWRRLGAEYVCLIRGRVRFGDHLGGAPFPSALQYVGPRGEEFAAAFASLGILYRVAPGGSR